MNKSSPQAARPDGAPASPYSAARFDVDVRFWRWFQRPHQASDPLRGAWYRIHSSDSYRPTNDEARMLAKRLKDTESERNRFEGALRAIRQNAEAWHGDDDAKGRALAVIARWTNEALPDE